MKLIIVYCLPLLLVSYVMGAKEVVYRFTARSFLPAACVKDYKTLNNSWSYASLGKTTPTIDYPSGSHKMGSSPDYAYCPNGQDILDGIYDGHPDFEADSASYQDGNSGTSFNLTTFALGGVPPDGTPITAIVERGLDFSPDGLPKPQYCKNNGGQFPTINFPRNTDRCGWKTVIPFSSRTSTDIEASTTGKANFDVWYRDNKKYNMRQGFRVSLNPIGNGSFQFDASGNMFPLASGWTFPNKTSRGKPCSVDGANRLIKTSTCKSFPRAKKQGTDERTTSTEIFSFTTEHHSFFQLKGTEKFSFSGDDDVWVYMNNKLAVDNGGLHSSADATIDLSNAIVRNSLGMQINQIYPLDIYHAERHTHQSNFKITTSLTAGCNILESGDIFYKWNPATLSTQWKVVGGPSWGRITGSSILLTQSGVQHSVGYAFLRQQINTGTGFTIQFTFSATTGGEGFVFVIQRDDLLNINGGSGGNLGFKNTRNSFGIVFDFCTDRDSGQVSNPACSSSNVRMHYSTSSNNFTTPVINNATASTQILHAPLYFPAAVNNGENHTVLIRYFEKSPDWLEVFVDDDLILQKRGINLDHIIGGRNAFVGFTSSTGYSSNTIYIHDMEITTVQINDALTTGHNLPNNNEPTSALANGRDYIDFKIKNFDLCGNAIEFGGFGVRARGLLTSIPNNGRRLSGNDTTEILGSVVDFEDGTYALRFATTTPGDYNLQIWYGKGCFVGGVNTGAVVPIITNSTCFTVSRQNVATFSPVPTQAPTEFTGEEPLPAAALTGIGIAVGVISAIGGGLIMFGIWKRNQWRKDKKFVEAGKIAAAERGVAYLGDNELDALQNQLQATRHAINTERAKKAITEDKQNEINELLKQKGELTEMVRRLKARRDGIDPESPEAMGSFPARIRKSFAATKLSVGSRLSRGVSLAGPTSSNNDTSIFGRISRKVGNKKVEVDEDALQAGNPVFLGVQKDMKMPKNSNV